MEKEFVNINGDIYEKEYVDQKIREIKEKYTDKIIELFRSVCMKEINTYSMLEEEFEYLGIKYQAEMSEWDEFPHNIVYVWIKNIRSEHDNNKNIQDFASECIDIISTLNQKRFVFKDDEGRICDEQGRLLSEDGEHRVFDIVVDNRNKSKE